MTLYLKLHQPPLGGNDYHMQAEVLKENLGRLKDQAFPWQVYLDPMRLMLLK